MSGERLRLVEDEVNQALHPEGLHLRLWRHPDADLVTVSLSRVGLSNEYLGDQCPKAESRVLYEKVIHESELRGE